MATKDRYGNEDKYGNERREWQRKTSMATKDIWQRKTSMATKNEYGNEWQRKTDMATKDWNGNKGTYKMTEHKLLLPISFSNSLSNMTAHDRGAGGAA